MEYTKIEWSHHTFNPWGGCDRVSEGCANCYAAILAERFPDLHGTWGPDGDRIVHGDDYWQQPLKWDRSARRDGQRHRVFCASMADIFEDRPDLVEPRARLFTLIDQTPHLDWLLLTKRPQNILQMWPDSRRRANVWLGTSTENQSRLDERWPSLQACRHLSPVLYLSLEPLLGPVILPVGIDWAIIGGESGAKARPFDPDWVRNFLRQCSTLGIPPFVKQLGRNPVGLHRTAHNGTSPDLWPEDIRVRHFPHEERPQPITELERLLAENTELRRKLDEIRAVVA
jgi:protein gp37